MAGNYANAPGNRMALDEDGTAGFLISSTNTVALTMVASDLALLNDESDTTSLPLNGASAKYAVLIFPYLRDVAGYFVHVGQPSSGTVALSIDTSVNTTNGTDGTWVSKISSATVAAGVGPFGLATVPGYRSGIQPVVWAGVKAVRVAVVCTPTSNMAALTSVHLYGLASSGQVLDRLAIWDPILDQPVGPAYFDWGDVPRSSSMDRPFRVKNLSAALTAHGVTCSTDTLTDTVPSVPGQHLLSEGGSDFAATVTIPSLLAGEISSVITLRRVTPANAVLSLWTLRLVAAAASWE